jgi:hypothetical protein
MSMSYDDNCTPAQKIANRNYWALMYEDKAKTPGWDGMQRVMAEFRAETKTLGWDGMQRVMAEFRSEKEAKIDSQKKFTKFKFFDDEEAKILEGKILEQAEIDAKQAKQDEAAKEEFRLSYVAFMARTNAYSKFFEDKEAEQEAADAVLARRVMATQMAKTKKLADEQAKIDAKQAKIDALPPIGKFARKFWIVVGIEIARLSELYNNA